MINQEELIQTNEWDLIIILDACRYDIFKEVISDYNISGNLKEVKSFAGSTPQFYKLLPEYINPSDVNLFTANPTPFHHYNYDWKSGITFSSINPNDNLDEVREYIISAKGNKIIHLVPPHLPWLGEDGKDKIEELDLDPSLFPYKIDDESYEHFVYSRVDNARKYYEENLKYVLKSLEGNIPPIDNTVITSDHSESIKKGQHIRGSVPWFTVGWSK